MPRLIPNKDVKASIVIVINENKEVLIVKRFPESWWMPNKWGALGGLVDPGETYEQAAYREVKEECGLTLHNLFEFVTVNQIHIYYSTSYEGDIKLDFEHTDWAWVSTKDLNKYDTTPDLEVRIKQALKALKEKR